ncbi:DUF2267 domain-containing protein [Streptomyces sp. NPDC093018]|uniref:DUF2267 domain-containing protein n=1 Tax=Streptomyces sp. NPDC093018 TaxID=3155067 RepID=UPI003443EAE8
MTMTTTVPKPAVRPTGKNATAPQPAWENPRVRERALKTASKDTAAPGPAPRTTWEALTEAVRETGGYPTRAQAEHLTRLVLTALGTHLTGDERVALAQSLPPEAGHLIAAQIPRPHPLTARAFVDSLSTEIPDSTPATARWDVSSVLTAVSTAIGPDLTDQVLSQLSRGYALLFGRAELVAAMA